MIPAAGGICLFALQGDAQVPQTCLPPLNPVQLQPLIRVQSGGKEQFLAVFSYSNSIQRPYQQAGSVTQVQSVLVISIVLKGRLIALEVAKSRTGVLENIRGWHF